MTFQKNKQEKININISQLSQPSIKNIYKNIYNIFIINILGFLKMVDFWLTFSLLLVYFLDFDKVLKYHDAF